MTYSYEISSREVGDAIRGEPVVISGDITNYGARLAPEIAPGCGLKVDVEVRDSSGRKIISGRGDVSSPNAGLEPGETASFSLLIDTAHCLPGRYEIVVDLLYENKFWLGKKGGAARTTSMNVRAETSFAFVDVTAKVEEPRFWQQHVPEYNSRSQIPLRSSAFQTYDVYTSSGPVSARSMLTEFELAAMYALSRHYWRGEGVIIDLGPLLGVGTFVFASGLSQSGIHGKYRKILSYDLFLMSGMRHFLPETDDMGTGSIFHKFLDINRDHLSFVSPVPGDFLRMSYGGADRNPVY